jgi:hypothetical protein
MADDSRLAGAGRAAETELRESDLRGLKYFGRLRDLLAVLHGTGCQRDKAGNRRFHFDHYCLLMLLSMFSPMARSIAALQQAGEFKKVQKRLGVSRFSHGSFSEAAQVFDPKLLRPIVAQLSRESRRQIEPCGFDPRLAELKHTLTLTDGTLLVALPKIAAAAWGGQPTISKRGARNFAWRLHTQFEVLSGKVAHAELTDHASRGVAAERRVLARSLEQGRCYVMDRGYQSAGLFNQIHALGSSYVARVVESTAKTVDETRPLSEEARQQGILGDVVARLGGRGKTDHAVRVITIQVTPHVKRSGHKGDAGPSSSGVLILVTNLLDVPAEIIAVLYRYRWHIEIFFRFFKQVLGCGHLLSHRAEGIEIQTYCAIIACLILASCIPGRITKRTYEMLGWYLLGVADDEELEAHLQKLKARTS